MTRAVMVGSRRAVSGVVGRKVSRLQADFLSQSGRARAAATLARLRRAAGKDPGAAPDVWLVEFDDLPSSLAGVGDEPSRAEWAVHVALTLYAVHQQSQTKGMHAKSDYENNVVFGFGNAVRALLDRSETEGEGLEEGEMPTRFAAMVTAQTIRELAHYARQIVQQLKVHSIPLDYGRFAGQLYDYQNPYRTDSVRLAWAREFANYSVHTDSEASK